MSVAFLCGDYALPFTTHTMHTFKREHVHVSYRGPMWNWVENMTLHLMVPAIKPTMLRVANDNERKAS